jgi:hypothetical protein
MAEVTQQGVVLFDVDETLVHTGGSGARSWNAAFEKLYGIPADIGAHSSAGETDRRLHGRPSKASAGGIRVLTSSTCFTSGTCCNWPMTS